MKIISRKEFLEIDDQVLFSIFSPNIFHGLSVKEGNFCNDDYQFSDIIGAIENDGSLDLAEKVARMISEKESMPADFDFTERDGAFDEDEQYLIYEKADIEKLIMKLQGVIE